MSTEPKTLETLFEGVDGVSPALIGQLQPLFEARVDEAVKAKMDALEEETQEKLDDLQEKLDEAVSFNINEANADMAKKLDQFLESAVVDWANANSVAIQESAVVSAADSFFEHLSEAAKALKTTLPEGNEEEELENLKQKNESYKARLNDSMKQVQALSESIVESKRESIIAEVSVGMTSFGKQTLSEKCFESDFINEGQFKRLVEGYKHIIETNDDEDEKTNLKEGEGRLPQTADELDKQTKKHAKPVLESTGYGGVNMDLFLR